MRRESFYVPGNQREVKVCIYKLSANDANGESGGQPSSSFLVLEMDLAVG